MTNFFDVVFCFSYVTMHPSKRWRLAAGFLKVPPDDVGGKEKDGKGAN